MKQLIKISLGLIIVTHLIGCGVPKSPDMNIPDVKIDPKTEELIAMLSTCNKTDSELPLSQFDVHSAMIIQDKIESMDIESTDCDGKVTKSHGPVKEFGQSILVEPDSELTDSVNFIQVDNLRTCSIQKIDAVDENTLEPKDIELLDGTKLKVPGVFGSGVGFNGQSKILLSDSSLKISALYLNAKDGNNVITITYFGKCLKYKDKKDTSMKDSFNCEKAEELGKKQILMKLQIDRPEVAGILKKNTCTKK